MGSGVISTSPPFQWDHFESNRLVIRLKFEFSRNVKSITCSWSVPGLCLHEGFMRKTIVKNDDLANSHIFQNFCKFSTFSDNLRRRDLLGFAEAFGLTWYDFSLIFANKAFLNSFWVRRKIKIFTIPKINTTWEFLEKYLCSSSLGRIY